MRNLEIKSVVTGAEPDAEGAMAVFTDITFRVYREFDWKNNGPDMGRLFAKVVDAVEDS